MPTKDEVAAHCERLLRKIQVRPVFGTGSVSQGGKFEIIDDGMGYANPDGPASAAMLRELVEENERLKTRGDGHWETLRSVRDIARKGDCERIIQWVNDAGSGYVESAESTLASIYDRAVAAEARAIAAESKAEAMLSAGREIADKLWILRCNSKDRMDRMAAEKAVAQWDAAATLSAHKGVG